MLSLYPKTGSIQSRFLHIAHRNDMKDARRIIVKLGTALITRENEDGLALGRLASTVEQVSQLQNEGRQMLLVTSGAVAFGRQVLRKEAMMAMTMRKSLSPKDILENSRVAILRQACAAFGQKGLMSLYERMFQQYNIGIAQVLVTKKDFDNVDSRKNLGATLNELLNLNIIPVLNTNDAVAPCTDTDDEVTAAQDGIVINDNDSLAARLAVLISADLLLIMSDVNGLYTGPPGLEGSRLLNTFCPKQDSQLISFGARSAVGTGGMESKVKCASWALDHNVGVVISNGQSDKGILNIIDGQKIGTFFTKKPTQTLPVDIQAVKARDGSRTLQKLSTEQRKIIINKMASNLIDYSKEILQANKRDLEEATKEGLKSSLIGRLGLSEKKLQTLSIGLQQIAERADVLGQVVRQTRLADGIMLKQITTSIGVLLVIFESRPDSLPQIAALSICSGNGLLLKGGSEARYSNEILTKLMQDALEPYAPRETIALISTREQVADLLQLGKYIDLVIPRGSNELVRSVQKLSVQIPVLGHAEGICHVFIDKEANLEMALRIVRDSKCDYPSACNAMETLLIHKDLIRTAFFESLIDLFRVEKVKVYSGPRLSAMLPFPPPPANSLRIEYGDLQCCIEVVDDVNDAIDHINKFSSNHTDSIVTENQNTANEFIGNVDSACVFHNVSTRFSDGYRFGLGAEVGISTGRIHARGPVGVEGLLTTKWLVEADSENDRIAEWKCNATKGQIIAGGNGKGNQTNQLHGPRDVIVDQETNSLIIADRENRRVMRRSRQNKTNEEVIISNIDCSRLTMDKDGSLFVSDHVKNEVRRWKRGEKGKGTIVAGGNGKGDQLNQLNWPTFIFVDDDYSLYVSDYENHRVMKWVKDSKEGIVVAGGNAEGNSLRQLSSPTGVIVDQLGQIYVADFENNRVMRWCQGAKEVMIVVDGNGEGQQANQFGDPVGLSFDRQGNLYVADCKNNRIQKFDIE